MAKLLPIIHLVLVTAVIYTGVDLTYKLTIPDIPLHPAAISLSETVDQDTDDLNRRLSDYNIIFERNLFNSKEIDLASQKSPAVSSLEKTSLQLKLWGTVTGKGTAAYAVIESQEKTQQLYREGEKIQGATLKQVLRDRVILRTAGKDEVLEMQDKPQGGTPLLQEAVPEPMATLPSQVEKPETRTGAQHIILSRTEIDKAISDIGSMMTEAKVTPHFVEGNADPAGLKIADIKPGSLYQKMGLANGDIILGVEGRQIESLEDAMTFYESMFSQDSIVLMVERRGKLNHIEYRIE